jgi:hypothetical protein
MRLGAGRLVLLLLLAGAVCAGCGGPRAAPESPGRLPGGAGRASAEARKLSTGLPAVGPSDLVESLERGELYLDLAQGRCPLLPSSIEASRVQAGKVEAGRGAGSALSSFRAVKMVLCRYGPPPAKRPGKLPGKLPDGPVTVADPAAVESWRQRFDALPLVKPGNYPCPFDDGSMLMIAFQDGTGQVVAAWMSLRGCEFVTIGAETRGSGAAFRDELLRLLP